MKLVHPGYVAGHLDCRCWKTGEFVQVPCPWHDGHDKYPTGAYALWLRDQAQEFTETDEQREARESVRAFHFARYKIDPPAPVKSAGPGALEWNAAPRHR